MCPMCRTPLVSGQAAQLTRSLRLHRIVQQLKVRASGQREGGAQCLMRQRAQVQCTHMAEGLGQCTWQGDLADLHTHSHRFPAPPPALPHTDAAPGPAAQERSHMAADTAARSTESGVLARAAGEAGPLPPARAKRTRSAASAELGPARAHKRQRAVPTVAPATDAEGGQSQPRALRKRKSRPAGE